VIPIFIRSVYFYEPQAICPPIGCLSLSTPEPVQARYPEYCKKQTCNNECSIPDPAYPAFIERIEKIMSAIMGRTIIPRRKEERSANVW